MRQPNLTLTDPIEIVTATLVENYGPPDMLSVTGKLRDLQQAVLPDNGLLLVDDLGRQRFSGIPDPTGITRNGNRTGELTFVSDTAHLWWRICWPVPANPWTTAGQNATYDKQTGSLEARLLGYIDRNLGPLARTERRPSPGTPLTMPNPRGNRGAVATSQVRFDQLGAVVAAMAEQANLRVRIVQAGGDNPYLQLLVEETPDLRGTVRFGDVTTGDQIILDQSWKYQLGSPTGTTILAAAAGEGADRELGAISDSDAENLWNRRVEVFEDMRGTGDWPQAKKDVTAAANDVAAAQKVKIKATAERIWAQNTYVVAHAAAIADGTNNDLQDADQSATDAWNQAKADETAAANDVTAAQTAYNAAVTARDNALIADTAAINQQLAEALTQNRGISLVSAPVSSSSDIDLVFDVGLGAIVAGELDGLPIVDRLRQVTTTLARNEGEATVKVTGVIGSPDAGLQSPTQRRLAQALARITKLERSQ